MSLSNPLSSCRKEFAVWDLLGEGASTGNVHRHNRIRGSFAKPCGSREGCLICGVEGGGFASFLGR